MNTRLINMKDKIAQALSVYKNNVFLLVRFVTSEGLNPADIINFDNNSKDSNSKKEYKELVQFSANIENLVKQNPQFKLEEATYQKSFDDQDVIDYGRMVLVYCGDMNESEFLEYKEMLSSAQEITALENIYEQAQLFDVFFNSDILDGVDVLQLVNKANCISPEAAEAEREKAEDQAVSTLQTIRRSLEKKDWEETQEKHYKKIYEIVHVHSGEELVRDHHVLPKRAKAWAKRLGMPYDNLRPK